MTHAAAQVKNALDITIKLGGEHYVFWGGREGYNSLLNTDMKRELDHASELVADEASLLEALTPFAPSADTRKRALIAAGFAAWYRAFLRQSQERAKANRIAREQQMRAKAKEQERVAKEEQRVIRVADIAVNVVIDRIDELADGRRIVLDYKTGASIDIKNWASQRITEPQVPIYAALAGEDVSAIAFAKVQLDKPAFVGVAKDSDMLPGVPGIGDDKQKLFPPAAYPSWISVIQHWEARLEAIAQEIKDGHAPVLFADEKELQYCDVLPLLRLPEYRRLHAQSGSSAP